MQTATAAAHFFAGRYEDAFSWAEMAVREKASYALASSVAAPSGALAGRHRDAQSAMARLRTLEPSLRLSNLTDFFPIRRAEDLIRWEDGVRRAGLPE